MSNPVHFVIVRTSNLMRQELPTLFFVLTATRKDQPQATSKKPRRSGMNTPEKLLKEARENLDASYNVQVDNVELPTVYVLQSISGALQAIAAIMLVMAKRKPSER